VNYIVHGHVYVEDGVFTKEGTAVCAVCITDLEGTFPDVPPSFPVLWLVPKTPWTREEVTAPFGETIHFDNRWPRAHRGTRREIWRHQ
jgi:hypothetical protein